LRPVTDDKIKKILLERKKVAGNGGKIFPTVDEVSLGKYAHTLGSGYKTKNFRTHLGTSTARRLVAGMTPPKTEKELSQKIKTVGKMVSMLLGNTPDVALASYINPDVFHGWRKAIPSGVVVNNSIRGDNAMDESGKRKPGRLTNDKSEAIARELERIHQDDDDDYDPLGDAIFESVIGMSVEELLDKAESEE
jgi:hypothetical protein